MSQFFFARPLLRTEAKLELRNHTPNPTFTNFCHVGCSGRDSALFWRRSNTLYTSGFVDDVMGNIDAVAATPLQHRADWCWLRPV